MYNNDLSVFSFRNNSGTAQYSMNNGTSWVNFKNPTGTRSITTNGTYDVTNYASASVNVSTSLSETTLWTNSSPSSNFSGQTVSWSGHNLSEFTYIKIKVRHTTTNAGEVSNILSVSEFKTTSFGMNKLKMPLGIWQTSTGAQRYRPCMYSSDTSITFSNGKENTETNNAVFIPLEISGLK